MDVSSFVSPSGDGVTLAVRVTARGGRNTIDGVREDRLIVRVAAPPAEGAANKAVCKLIAKRLGVARAAVSIATGEGAREKLLVVAGIDAAAVAERLGRLRAA